MPDNPMQESAASVKVVDGLSAAPLIYFEEAPNFGVLNGVMNVTLAARRALPDGKGNITTDMVATAYLRGNIPAMRALREAIDQALLLAMPAQGDAH